MARSYSRSEEIWLGIGYYLLPLREPAASAILYQDWFYNFGGYSGCQLNYNWNYLKPKQLGTPERNFFLNKILEAGRPTFNPDHLRWEDPAFIRATPPADSSYKADGEGKLPLWLLALTLTGEFIPSLALKSTSSGFQCIIKANWDIQPCGIHY